jgi:hypothetical protein
MFNTIRLERNSSMHSSNAGLRDRCDTIVSIATDVRDIELIIRFSIFWNFNDKKDRFVLGYCNNMV